jgi:hypothetical protein
LLLGKGDGGFEIGCGLGSRRHAAILSKIS